MTFITEGEMSRVLILMTTLNGIEAACKDVGIEDAIVSFDVSIGDANGETLGVLTYNPSTGTYVFKAQADDDE